MRILINGGTGFIGTYLQRCLPGNITLLSRKPNKNEKTICTLSPEDQFDIIINLAGKPLDEERWNKKVKASILESRIEATKKIISFIKSAHIKPKLLISASAIGFYGESQTEIFNETSSPKNPAYGHYLCQEWEKCAFQAENYGVRTCITRFGIVLGKGGALQKMLFPFKLGLGASLGSGQQWMSWIHIKDVVKSIQFLINHDSCRGVFNFTAPSPITNIEFSNSLAHTLHRTRFLNIPASIATIIFGEMAEEILLKGQNVVPEHLKEEGFNFEFKSLKPALRDILG